MGEWLEGLSAGGGMVVGDDGDGGGGLTIDKTQGDGSCTSESEGGQDGPVGVDGEVDWA